MNLQSLFENLKDWDTGRWVHYSDSDFMKINMAPSHQDPLGIFGFPEKFNPNPYWINKPYKFVFVLKPGAKILDCAKITMDQLHRLIDLTGVREPYEDYVKRYPPKNMIQRFKMFWEQLRNASYTTSSRAKINKALRQAGWNAIFDDTGSVHSAEVQLLVLDPRIIKIVDFEKTKRPAFAAIQKIISDLKEICHQYGTIEVEGPRKMSDGYLSGSPKILMAKFRIEAENGNYANLAIRYDPDGVPNHKNTLIQIGLEYSKPSLGYGVGATFDFGKNEYQRYGGLDRLKQDLDQVFLPKEEPALVDSDRNSSS